MPFKKPFERKPSSERLSPKKRQIQRLASALSLTAKSKTAIKFFCKNGLGGKLQREKIYADIVLGLSRLPKGRKVSEMDFFNVLFERKIEIPVMLEVFNKRAAMRAFAVPETQRMQALTLLELKARIADFALKLPFSETIKPKELVPIMDFAIEGIKASRETKKGTPAFKLNMQHYNEMLAMLEMEKKALEALERKGVKYRVGEINAESLGMLRALGERGLSDIIKANSLLGVHSALLDFFHWEALKYFKHFD
ncbi:MAG: hypothetical protein QXK06_03665 [Candidatus Diapherotrites archaeon]